MKLHNLNDPQQHVSFKEAVMLGLGRQQGLFFPTTLPRFSAAEIDSLLQLDFITRSAHILSALIGDEISPDLLQQYVTTAFSFPVPIHSVTAEISALELFHGPTLAFKDFGARFMAQILASISQDKPITILTATSGDTGAAVAQAFYGIENVQVVILYPEGKISPLQEKLFCTLGKNIHTIAIAGDFDDCQQLVKQAFDDTNLVATLGLNSANSINVSRLLAQVCYYFEAVAQLDEAKRQQVVVSVPSGNFGNLTAGLIAKRLGLPIKRFIAATNANDTVPRYFATQQWLPNATIATLSNSMDVSRPNNWPRVEALLKQQGYQCLTATSVSEEQTVDTIQDLANKGYLSEPHGAVAYRALADQLEEGEHGIFLATAHPAKFKESVETILQYAIEVPEALAQRALLPIQSHYFANDFARLQQFLLTLSKK